MSGEPMNYNFTNSTRLALNRAHDEAIALRHGYVGVEHILLGLLGDEGIAAMLGTLGTTTDSVRAAVVASCRAGDSRSPQDISYTSNAKEIIELAMSEARNRNADAVNCEHMFIAIL